MPSVDANSFCASRISSSLAATLEAGGCQLPISLDIAKYRGWVEKIPQAFENGANVYLIGEVGAFMLGEFDPEDFSSFDAYLALEVDVMPVLME